ncbi:WSC domain-containing protein [Hypomontagnella monticulosa]|nr:WSC domain-containing protein [Hypomontagnella monticulosa]
MGVSKNALLSILAVAFYGRVDAYWRMSCSLIQTGRLDPNMVFIPYPPLLKSPGAVSAHVHKVSGASNFGLSNTYEDLISSSCTSCEVQDDKSIYWTPQLYYEYTNGSFLEVPNGGTVVYYLGRGENRSNIEPFPPGFQMVSGDPYLRSNDTSSYTYGDSSHASRLVSDRVSFACLDSSGSMPEQNYLFRTDCDNGLRAQIQFPSCWDGRDYQMDQSHVAYMSAIDNGVCPPSHPRQLVHLFFEVIYGVNDVPKEDGGRFVFANGDPTGFGFHGDFMNGWDSDVLKEALDTCVNDDSTNGQISLCPPLAKSQTPYYATNCPERPAIVNEAVKNMIDCLPGCNVVTTGPERATQLVCPDDHPSTNARVEEGSATMFNPTIGETLNGSTFVFAGCVADSGSSRSIKGYSFTASNMTLELCTSTCSTKGYPLAGVEYSTECYCGRSFSSNATSPYDCSTTPQMICGGNASEYCGAPNLLAVWNDTSAAVSTLTAAVTTINNGSARYLGCYTDSGSDGRTLSQASYSSDSMTANSCATYCQSKNYALSGVEYGGECYCGNALKASSTAAAEADCNMSCRGNSSQVCGGPSRISVWNNTLYVATRNLATVSTGGYAYLGCYTEGTSGRALARNVSAGSTSTSASTSDGSMTVEKCASYCSGKGYTYMGVEYSQECYCNNDGPLNGATKASESDCSMTCKGDLTEWCGGSSRISVYKVASA